jgi:hypothetical protein
VQRKTAVLGKIRIQNDQIRPPVTQRGAARGGGSMNIEINLLSQPVSDAANEGFICTHQIDKEFACHAMVPSN